MHLETISHVILALLLILARIIIKLIYNEKLKLLVNKVLIKTINLNIFLFSFIKRSPLF